MAPTLVWSYPRRNLDRRSGKGRIESTLSLWAKAYNSCALDPSGPADFLDPLQQGPAQAAGQVAAPLAPVLAEYEAYRARLSADPLGAENHAYAQDRKFILREDRTFLKLVSTPHRGAA